MEKEKIKQIIRDTILDSIINFASRSLTRKPEFQILDLIIPKERKIRSIVGGMETSLGKTLWEPLAKALSKENGFEIIEKDLEAPTNFPSILASTLHIIIDERKKDSNFYNAISSHEAIKQACQTFINNPISNFEKAPRGRGVDIWLKKDNVNYFFDTKTVQPNVGTFRILMEQVLYWYAYY
ncbi:TdeIII family type II restriction endonuclease, partial [Leptospira levettii]|uniref:TdeIII family type II restriction endonuclease n=1 Tax=Leptospira levettii TaxID=2023178 RepID=UPI00108402B3